MIEVELRLLAGMKKNMAGPGDGNCGRRLRVQEGTTCAKLLEMAGIEPGRTLVVLLNGRYAEAGVELSQGDVVSVFPPVAGG